MGAYSANEAKSYEFQGADTFRIEKSGDRAQVVFLYTDKNSIDGYACHRLMNASHYTYVVDCARGPKDELDVCPACKDGAPISNRILVKVLDLNSNKVVIWDKPSSFRKTLEGFIYYFPCLYKQKYEITREGQKLDTKYQFQSIGDSGITEEQFQEYCEQAEEAISNYVRPADKYLEIKARVEASLEAAGPENGAEAPANNIWNNAPAQSGWSQPAPPQNNGWGAPPAQGNWSQAPQPAAPQAQAPQAPVQSGGWGAPVQGNWSQAPQGNGAWSQNPPTNG